MSDQPVRLVVKTGSYQDRKTGETKHKYVTLGTAYPDGDGGYGFLEPTVDLAAVFVLQRIANPAKAGDRIMFSMYPLEQKQKPASETNGESNKPEFDDDIPF